VPITFFYCAACGKEIIDEASLARVAEFVAKEGADAWFDRDVKELAAPGLKCPSCGKTEFTKEEDILDVWFDSGVSFAAVCEKNPGLKPVADMYLEGSDQHRGWFHSSLLASVGTRGHAPYKEVLTHGFLVDGEGKKMSKSLGNFIAPEQVIEKYGAEVLRLWVSAEDYRDDIRISEEILQRQSEAYRRIRNTARFILGNLYDFDPKKDLVGTEQMLEIDRFVLIKFTRLSQRIMEAYRTFDFHLIYHSIHNFCTVTLSAFYLDILKDRLYTEPAGSKKRRAAQSAMYTILSGMTRLMAPILSFTADEIWETLPGDGKEPSVHLAAFAAVEESIFDDGLEGAWDKLIEVRTEVQKILEEARRNKVIGHSLDAAVTLAAKGKEKELLTRYAASLADVFIVSRVSLAQTPPKNAAAPDSIPGLSIAVAKADGLKCPRCWNYTEDIGADAAHPEVCVSCAENLKG
jgi:isoleucyl-tRNA synthetase